MSLPARILLVDDEENIRLTLGTMLRHAGYEVVAVEDGASAVSLLDQQRFDLLVVDLKLPGMDGLAVVAAARQRQAELAIIVLTGHGSLETAIEGLHQGIFDYVLKTTPPPLVCERVSAALAARQQTLRQRQLLDAVDTAVRELQGDPLRAGSKQDAGAPERGLAVRGLQLDVWRQEVSVDGRKVTLTPTEFRLLVCLARHSGETLSFTELVSCAHGYTANELTAGELIKPHIHHLRQKLEPEPGAPRYIMTIRGKGYMLAGDDEGASPRHR